MRYMLIVKGSTRTEAGEMPSQELIEQMGKFNEELLAARVMVDGGGLHPSSRSSRVHFNADGSKTVTRGPFPHPEQMTSGFWILKVDSEEEAFRWAERCPNPAGPGFAGEVELRKFFEPEDFAPSATIDREIEMAAELEKKRGR